MCKLENIFEICCKINLDILLQKTRLTQPVLLKYMKILFFIAYIINLFRISDISGQTKLLLLCSNLFEIAGCIMYFIAGSAWFLVGSRFVSGIVYSSTVCNGHRG